MKLLLAVLFTLEGACAIGNALYAQEAIPAASFFGGPGDRRRVIYIELADDERLVFDAAENGSYVLNGKNLEIRAKIVEIRGVVTIRAFPEGSEAPAKAGTGGLGDEGSRGTDGNGDGQGGGRGGRGGRGKPGEQGNVGRSAGRVTLFVENLVPLTPNSKLIIDATGERGGKGQKGGKGGTGGRGGDGQDRAGCDAVCRGCTGPGNAGPKGAPGAPGTGGVGGVGGNGGNIRFGSTLCTAITNQVLAFRNEGGKGGEPGDPGEEGRAGDPGEAGSGNSCGGGGSAENIAPESTESYIPPAPSGSGQSGVIQCTDCNSGVCPN